MREVNGMSDKRSTLEIRETNHGIFFNGVKQTNIHDLQIIKNYHRKVKVQVTYWADSFIKEDFGNSSADSRNSDR